MKIKITKIPNILQIMIFYIFGMLYIQIIEIWFSFSITKILGGFLLCLILWGSLNKKIIITNTVWITIFLGLLYIIYYYVNIREVFFYVYPVVVVAVISLLLTNNLQKLVKYCNWKKINYLIFIYLLLNIFLYLIKFKACFQVAGREMQFKGALPHSNMFASVMFSFFIMIFWNKDSIAKINRILIIALTFASLSRTYILVLLFCILLQLLIIFFPSIKFSTKLFLFGGILLIVSKKIFETAVMVLPSLIRFKNFGFGANGRQYLQESYCIVIKTSGIGEKLLGFPMVKQYLNGIKVLFSHSFTENSLIGIFLLFGLSGIIILLLFIFRIFKINHSSPIICITIAVFTSLLTQDTLLSVQTGILLAFSMVCMVSNKT